MIILEPSPAFISRSVWLEEDSHTYFLDGEPCNWPSTTGVTSWADRVSGKRIPIFPPGAAEAGTRMHAAIEADLGYTLDETLLDAETALRLEANREFRRRVGFEVAWIRLPDGTIKPAVEVAFWHPWGYFGVIDALGVFADKPNQIDVVDWKSIYTGSIELQTTAYEQGACFAFPAFAAQVRRRRWCTQHKPWTDPRTGERDVVIGLEDVSARRDAAEHLPEWRTWVAAYHAALRRGGKRFSPRGESEQ